MTLLTYSAFALPLWAAQFALYFFLRSAGKMKESLVAKCAGSFLAVGSAAFAFASQGGVLEISFVPGMLVFGAAHVCLILWLWERVSLMWICLILWAAVYILTAILFRKELPTLGKLTVPFLLYPALLGGSLALAVPHMLFRNLRWWPVALGTVLFYISDMLVAKNQLSHWDDKWQKPIMVLYWAALYFISVGPWVTSSL